MRGKIAFAGAVAVLLAATSANAAPADAPQDSNGQQSGQPNGNVPPPAQPKVKKGNALLPGLGALAALGAGGAAAVSSGSDPVSP
jgi:hypothetical protein